MHNRGSSSSGSSIGSKSKSNVGMRRKAPTDIRGKRDSGRDQKRQKR